MRGASDRPAHSYLGLSLEEAVGRLRMRGIEPTVRISSAPRRPEGTGVLRVVRQCGDGRELTVCAFLTRVEEENA